jgi:hypothetical protein
MASWPTRLKLILFTLVVASGGSGLPLLDALLYHTRASEIALGTHIEAAGSPTAHAELCTLGRAAPASTLAARGDGGLRVVPVTYRTRPPLRVTPPRAADRPDTRCSRAPPLSIV